MTSLRSFFLAPFLFSVVLAGCDPLPASMPTQTWRPGEEQKSCGPGAFQNPDSGAWASRDQLALRAKLERGEPTVVSALGCRVEVLERCSADADVERTELDGAVTYDLIGVEISAQDLRGACSGATHVVEIAAVTERGNIRHVSLRELTLGGFDLTGTWEGVMRQPGGPYQTYDIRFDLEQRGDRVRGTSDVTTDDGEYWGRLVFKGRIEGTKLFFADVSIVDQEIDLLLAWCMKGGFAVVDPRSRTMRGPWRAFGCLPGSIETKQVGTAARSSPAGTVQSLAPPCTDPHRLDGPIGACRQKPLTMGQLDPTTGMAHAVLSSHGPP